MATIHSQGRQLPASLCVYVDCSDPTGPKKYFVTGCPGEMLTQNVYWNSLVPPADDEITWTELTHLGLWMWTDGEFVLHRSLNRKGHWLLPGHMMLCGFLSRANLTVKAQTLDLGRWLLPPVHRNQPAQQPWQFKQTDSTPVPT